MEGMKERRVCMIQRSLWKRPALQTSEAVLLPALPRMKAAEPVYSDGYLHVRPTEDPFRPVEETPRTALSTYVRPRGSMAGRSVLRYWRGSLSASKNGKRMAGPADGALFPMVSRKETGQRLSLFHLSNFNERTAGSRRHIPGCRSIRRYRPSSTDYQECWCGVRCWT